MDKNKENTDSTENGWEILNHDPVPGYRTAFHIIVLLSSIYLIIIFAASFI